jgi:hypothetical protein
VREEAVEDPKGFLRRLEGAEGVILDEARGLDYYAELSGVEGGVMVYGATPPTVAALMSCARGTPAPESGNRVLVSRDRVDDDVPVRRREPP